MGTMRNVDLKLKGIIYMKEDTATTSYAAIITNYTATSLLVHNIGDTNDLWLTNDGGTTKKTISPGDAFSADGLWDHANCKVRTNAGTTDYEVVYTQ